MKMQRFEGRKWEDVIIHEASLPEEVEEKLVEQGVKMDDYDYVVFFPNTTLSSDEWSKDTCDIADDFPKLLNGAYENEWFWVKNFFGQSGLLGVAYHA